jgi:electron transfer flavoprotein alpha subunit
VKVLVLLEHAGGGLLRGSAGVLAQAARLAEGPVAAVLTGPASGDGADRAVNAAGIVDGARSVDMDALAVEAGRCGAAKVYLARADVLDPPLPQPHVDVMERVVVEGGYDTVLLSNSVLAADVASGLAARLGAGLNWDLVEMAASGGELTAKRLAFQDSTLVEVGWCGERRVGLFRPGAFDPVPVGEGIPEIEEVAVDFRPYSVATVVRSRQVQPEDESGPSVEEADVIVAGGMGLGSAENFALAEQLARELGGVVGATRAAVYAGWYPRAAQIGQTGKTVTPKLYVALGISGAVQHKVGMQGSKQVVAINKDPSAPIFDVSDLAVVGDVQTVVPQLIELLRQGKGI